MIDEITRALNSKSDKVDLKAEKIELTIVGDIDKGIKEALKELDSVEKLKAKAKQPITDAISANRQAGIIATNTLKLVENFKQQAKELGIDVPANIKDMEGRADKIITDFKASQSKLISINAEL
jgi:hypothetical protein